MKRFILGLAALLALALPSVSHGQGLKIAEKTLVFQRTDATFPGLAYVTDLANGNHPAAGVGIAVAPQDTAVVDISDHWYRSASNIPRAFPGAGAASDSVWVGTLTIEGTSSTIDTLFIFKDVSPDGVNWTGNDSLAYHLVTGQVAVGIVAASSDSVRPILATTGQGALQAGKKATITFFGYPAMTSLGITGLALADVNFVRFRIKMTPGDFAAAGTTAGVRGSFRYPAFK